MSSRTTARHRVNLNPPVRLESGTHPVKRDERRTITRFPVELAARFVWDERQLDCMVSDIAVTGAFVRSAVAPPYGARITLLIEDGRRKVTLPAIVRWADERGFGCQFEHLGAIETSVVTSLVSRARVRMRG